MLEVVPESLGAGALVARRYRLRHVLGQGGMGVVWAADEEPSGRPVALKLLHGESAKDPKSHERFLREARAALTITHPNVARVHEVGETDSGTPFIVMDRLVGESLRARLATWGRLPVGDCAWIARGIVAAVGAAHRVAIVHRDLKPENVFLVPAGSPRPHVLVLDFGIAKSMLPDAGAPSLTSTGTILGTPYYMAPEQIYGDVDVDARADVWALGVLIYECLYGQRPTEAAGVGQILKLITNDQIVPLARAAPHLPAEISALVDRMLSRHREGRPSLAEVEAVLARLDPGPAGTMATPLAPTLAPRSAPMAPTVPQAPPSGLGAPTAPGPTPNLVVPATAALARPSASPPTPQGPHPTLGASPPPTAGGSKAPLALAVAAGALALLGAASLAGVIAMRRYLPPDGHEAVAQASAAPGASATSRASPSATANAGAVAAATGAPTAAVPPPATVAPGRSSGAPSATAPASGGRAGPAPAPTPTPSAAPSAPEKRVAWEVGFGRMWGFSAKDNETIFPLLRTNAPSLKDCLPAPTADVVWSLAIRFNWPKRQPGTVSVTAAKNGQSTVEGEAPGIASCAQQKVTSWRVPDATGQDYSDAGTSYLFMSAGYYRRSF